MSEFTGQTILITGGGTGIGKATALLFAKHGANVVVNYSRSKAEAEETVAAVQELGTRAIAVQANVADNAAVVAMVERTIQEFGRLDIAVNNAGMTHIVPYTDLDELSEDKWDDILGVNVKGTFFCSRAAIAEMKKAGRGHIINVSSIAAATGRGSSICLLYTSPSPRDRTRSRMPSSA